MTIFETLDLGIRHRAEGSPQLAPFRAVFPLKIARARYLCQLIFHGCRRKREKGKSEEKKGGNVGRARVSVVELVLLALSSPLIDIPAPVIMIIVVIIKGNWSGAGHATLATTARCRGVPLSKRRCSCTCTCRCPARFEGW